MKNVLVSFVLLCMVQLCGAQDIPNSKWRIGIEGGPESAFINGWNSFSGFGWKNGLAIGASAEYHISTLFSLKSGLLFQQKGDAFKEEWTDTAGRPVNGSFTTAEDQLNYLVLPVLARLSFGKKLKFFVDAGPYFGFLLNATYSISNETSAKGTTYLSNRDEKKDFSGTDFGLSAGLGIGIPIKDKFQIDIEFRYDQGFQNEDSHKSDIQNGPHGPPLYPLPVLNNESAELLVGLSYKL